MSIFARPSIAFAIIFGCFAVLIPRIFLPLLRPRPTHQVNDHFRRPPPSSMHRHDHDAISEPNPSSSSHMHNLHPNMRMHHPGVHTPQESSTDQSTTKSAMTFALPMYTVGIAVFFIYTCFKYWGRRNDQENKLKSRYSSKNIQWNAQQKKFKYHLNNRYHVDEDDDRNEEEDIYAGLDTDYVEYLKAKRQKELEAKQTLSTEQKQMHQTLDDMKHSLSFISSKLGTNTEKNSLTNIEISQLQDRLASTEAQMYKILNALDAASNKMNELTNNTRESLEQPQQVFIPQNDYRVSSGSHSESEDSINDEENSNSDEDSFHEEEQILSNDNKKEEEEESSSSSSYEDEEVPNEKENDHDDDDESESSSDRYGIMTTNYDCDPTTIDDYELNSMEKPVETSDSRTKVQEWRQRNHSQSLSSNSSVEEQDQSIPADEQNHLIRRKIPK